MHPKLDFRIGYRYRFLPSFRRFTLTQFWLATLAQVEPEIGPQYNGSFS